jgi:predicted flavoprotein YhiN
VIVACGSSGIKRGGEQCNRVRTGRKTGTYAIVKPLPSLCGIRGKDNYYAKWAGSRMDGRITLESEMEKSVGQEQGEILFTEYGISGIGVFQLSRYAVRGTDGRKIATVYHLDLMPKLTKEELVQYLADRQRQNGTYKNSQELLIGLLPKKIIDVLVKKTYEPEKIAEKLKDWQISGKRSIRTATGTDLFRRCGSGRTNGSLRIPSLSGSLFCRRSDRCGWSMWRI